MLAQDGKFVIKISLLASDVCEILAKEDCTLHCHLHKKQHEMQLFGQSSCTFVAVTEGKHAIIVT